MAAVDWTPRDLLLLHSLVRSQGTAWDEVAASMVHKSVEDVPTTTYSAADCESQYAKTSTEIDASAQIDKLQKHHVDQLRALILTNENEYKSVHAELEKVKKNQYAESKLKQLFTSLNVQSSQVSKLLKLRNTRGVAVPVAQAAKAVDKSTVSETTAAAHTPTSVIESNDKHASTSIPVADSPAVENQVAGMASPAQSAQPASVGASARASSPAIRAGRSRSGVNSQNEATARKKSTRNSVPSTPQHTSPPSTPGNDSIPQTTETEESAAPARPTRGRRGRPPSVEKPVAASNASAEPETKSEAQLTTRRGRKRTIQSDDARAGSPVSFELNSPETSPEPPHSESDGDNPDETDEGRARVHRSWRQSVMQLWHQIAENKNANLFKSPVDSKKVEGYDEVVLRPMDLSSIKKSVETGQFTSIRDVEHAILLMFSNALMFNTRREFIYNATLEMRGDALTRLEWFRETLRSAREDAGDSGDSRKKDETPMSRNKRKRTT